MNNHTSIRISIPMDTKKFMETKIGEIADMFMYELRDSIKKSIMNQIIRENHSKISAPDFEACIRIDYDVIYDVEIPEEYLSRDDEIMRDMIKRASGFGRKMTEEDILYEQLRNFKELKGNTTDSESLEFINSQIKDLEIRLNCINGIKSK